MASRAASSTRRTTTGGPVSIDVVLLALRAQKLHVLAETTDAGRKRFALPWGAPARGEHLDAAAARIARAATGARVDWMEQAGAFGDGTQHPSGTLVSVCYLGVRPWIDVTAPWTWIDVRSSQPLAERQRHMVAAALTLSKSRLEQAPLGFSLLPRTFTLAELQQAYETVLGRRLHKASFRRALQAAFLVEPTGEWRGEGRGRPAQLYRYAPRRRKGSRRGVRLDLL
jgi:8-oxo-dGTP diphosphatase